MRFGAMLLTLAITTAHAAEPATEHETDFIVRAWDPWSLLDHRPANRRLWSQHAAHRNVPPTARSVMLADALTGTQVPRKGAYLGAWHGHAIIDGYAAARIGDNIDLNLNLIAYNMSASYGYRNITGVLPGVATHLHGTIDGMQADLLAIDLSTVTLGQGLMFEQLPLEGGMGRLKWDDTWVRLVVGGQLHYQSDDLFMLTVGWRDWQLSYLTWPRMFFDHWPQWLNASGEVPGLPDSMRLGLEGIVRVDGDGRGRTAAMARVDWMPRLPGGALHLGYQYRWYQRGVGPLGTELAEGFTAPAYIWREDTYATNAYEAYWPSGLFDQQWHTLMAEADVPLGQPWVVGRIETEVWLRLFDDPSGPEDSLPVVSPDGTALRWWPQPDLRVYYRAGLEFRVLRGRPDRLRIWVINKVADTEGGRPTRATRGRLVEGRPLIALELEVFL